MLDFHHHPENWGIHPVLFRVGELEISSYAFFMFLAIVVGVVFYLVESRKHKFEGEDSFYVAIAAVVGGILGAKIPIWIMTFPQILAALPDVSLILSGRTITGGLVGGAVGVICMRHRLGIKSRKGNLFAPGIALGMGIGRIGCFLAGCCYGVPTGLPWGVNFGDGIMRHPTQLYEFVFMMGLFGFLWWKRNQNPKPGQLFSILMISYFTFRFFIEFIRVEEIVFLGLTFFQVVSVFVVGWFLLKEFKSG